ncbi:hypothetical protein PMIN06_001390 [Paraphaeosphaeria minitans]
MSNSKVMDKWNAKMEEVRSEIQNKSKKELESAVNYLKGPQFISLEPLFDKKQRDKSIFEDHGFKADTLYYRKPEKYWNEVGLLVPDNIKYDGTAAPVHVFFMGGGFWTGDWKFCPWYLHESLCQARDQGAVILAVNYPRFPLADINDITRAVDDFWAYFYDENDFTEDYKHAFPGLSIDRKRLLVSGESAGGYVAAYSVMCAHPKLEANALFLRYPMLRHYKRDDRDNLEIPYMGESIVKKEAQEGANALWEVVQRIRGEMKKAGLLGLSDQGVFADILERRTPPYGMCGAFMTSWVGTWVDYFGGGPQGEISPDVLTLMVQANSKRQRLGPGAKIPALFIYHGTDDKNVPFEVSKAFVKEWRTMFEPQDLGVFFLKVHKGHGFDYVIDGNFEFQDGDDVPDKSTTMRVFMDAMSAVWNTK